MRSNLFQPSLVLLPLVLLVQPQPDRRSRRQHRGRAGSISRLGHCNSTSEGEIRDRSPISAWWRGGRPFPSTLELSH